MQDISRLLWHERTGSIPPQKGSPVVSSLPRPIYTPVWRYVLHMHVQKVIYDTNLFSVFPWRLTLGHLLLQPDPLRHGSRATEDDATLLWRRQWGLLPEHHQHLTKKEMRLVKLKTLSLGDAILLLKRKLFHWLFLHF